MKDVGGGTGEAMVKEDKPLTRPVPLPLLGVENICLFVSHIIGSEEKKKEKISSYSALSFQK